MIKINFDNLETLDETLLSLKVGDRVLISGTVTTARDAGHKELKKLIDSGEKLPCDFNNGVIYYAGPTDTPPGFAVGSIGPTTSARMDAYCEYMKTLGVKALIGKGERNDHAKSVFARDKIVYFIATGGCGALLANAVKKCQVVAFDYLGCESIKKLYVEDFPATVAYDLNGGDIFNG